MNDIVERLCEAAKFRADDEYAEAAAEIERLREHALKCDVLACNWKARAEKAEASLDRECEQKYKLIAEKLDLEGRAEKAEAKVAQLEKVIEELNRAVARSETL